MKTISIKSEWSWAIAKGYKPVENRTFSRQYRGLIAIHASKTKLKKSEKQMFIEMFEASQSRDITEEEWEEIEVLRGNVIGFCSLDEIIPPGEIIIDLPAFEPWYIPDCYWWKLSGFVPLPQPIPATGSQTVFWNWEHQDPSLKALDEGNFEGFEDVVRFSKYDFQFNELKESIERRKLKSS
jgi:hypothetical protein